MAYTKNTWNTGDIVSSQKLNHMEDGIVGAYEVMVINDDDGTLDKTWQEIHDAMAQGKLCVVMGAVETGFSVSPVTLVNIGIGGVYKVEAGESSTYTASSATEYPKTGGPS